MKITISVLLLASNFIAQNHSEPCAFDHISNNQNIVKAEKVIQQGAITLKSNHTIKTIPVVVHVFHQGGTENISETQIQSQIDVLNEDYGKLTGTPGDGNGVDTEVRFKLAKIDPNGNCTNGVVRINSSLTNHKTYERPLLKQISFWDNTKYLNIYIVKSIPGGTLGYSSFPGGPADEDGLVVRHNYFGRIGTASSSMGRTGTHEVGHWLGLYHTFNNSCGTDLCTDGDYVCDTPPVATANFGCSASNSCSNDSPDLPDQIENYMDYTSEICSNMFTEGQRLRVQSSLTNLRADIWTQTNLVATGTDSLYAPPLVCSVVADFTSLNPEICVNNDVNFINTSLNEANAWTWYFQGGTPSTSNIENPVVNYSSLGMFDVSLVVTNGTTTDSIVMSNFVSVTNPGVGQTLPFQENFDSGIFPPNGISINNPDGGIGWELDSNASVSPNYSIRLDNLNSTNYGTIDEVVLPFLDLSSNTTTPWMKFNWAYAKSVSLYTDELIVQLSTDCGATWTQILYKNHNSLVTGPTQTTPFIPDDSQWKNAKINLSAYSNEQNVLIKIMNVTDGGNYLYIDDITIGDNSLSIENIDLLEGLKIYPNPTSGSFSVAFEFENNLPTQLRIFSVEGKLIRQVAVQNSITAIDLENVPTGIYFLMYEQNELIRTRKINIK